MERCCVGIKIDTGIMGESAQAGGIFAFQVACTSREVGIITVPLFKSLLVKFYVLFGIVGQAVYRKNDADAPAAYGSIAKKGVRTAGNLLFPAVSPWVRCLCLQCPKKSSFGYGLAACRPQK